MYNISAWISILYTRTDFMPLADSQNKDKIYSVFLYPVYSSSVFIYIYIYIYICHAVCHAVYVMQCDIEYICLLYFFMPLL